MSDYGGFGAIVREAQQIEADERDRKESACPLCGEILERNRAGVPACPLGHYRGKA